MCRWTGLARANNAGGNQKSVSIEVNAWAERVTKLKDSTEVVVCEDANVNDGESVKMELLARRASQRGLGGHARTRGLP